MTPPPDDSRTAARVRGLLADVAELAQVRLELFAVEARQDLARLAGLAGLAVLAAVFIAFGLVFLAVFLTVLLWDSQRLLALGVFTAFFLGGGAALAGVLWLRARRGVYLLSATREELRRDRERLRA
jgi:uncharacterized membrane protein YqjE